MDARDRLAEADPAMSAKQLADLEAMPGHLAQLPLSILHAMTEHVDEQLAYFSCILAAADDDDRSEIAAMAHCWSQTATLCHRELSSRAKGMH